MKAICEKYGALFILDEVMSGMGRCGTLHAWEDEGVVPDLQTIGKGLGGGYAPVSGLLIGEKIVEAMDKGTGIFRHGQTYQGHPVGCAAALAVQKTIKEENLLENVRAMGAYLEKQLRARLESHPNVGDIRGKGLFWGVRRPSAFAYRRGNADQRRYRLSSSRIRLQRSLSLQRLLSPFMSRRLA
jgi:adenosylmethionine-8-amino-7-oxononanoate aminotransferase